MYAEFSLSFSELDGVSSDGGLVLSRSACASACLGPVSIHAKSYKRCVYVENSALESFFFLPPLAEGGWES